MPRIDQRDVAEIPSQLFPVMFRTGAREQTRIAGMMDFDAFYTKGRRRGPDILIESLTWFGVTGWLLLVTGFLFFGYAKPEDFTFFDQYLNVKVRPHWRMDLIRYMFYCMVGGLVFSLSGIVVNLRRNRRKTDEFRVSLALVAFISLAGIVFYLIRFG